MFQIETALRPERKRSNLGCDLVEVRRPPLVDESVQVPDDESLLKNVAVVGKHGKKPMSDMTGGCLCGRVRYTLTGEPAFSGLCHCRNCQRYTGTSFETFLAFPAASVSIRGELKTYEDTGDSGRPVRRRFCPNCGSGVIAEADVLPAVMIVLAGTLDDPAAFKPTVDVYWSSAQPWVHSGDERTKFPKMPG